MGPFLAIEALLTGEVEHIRRIEFFTRFPILGRGDFPLILNTAASRLAGDPHEHRLLSTVAEWLQTEQKFAERLGGHGLGPGDSSLNAENREFVIDLIANRVRTMDRGFLGRLLKRYDDMLMASRSNVAKSNASLEEMRTKWGPGGWGYGSGTPKLTPRSKAKKSNAKRSRTKKSKAKSAIKSDSGAPEVTPLTRQSSARAHSRADLNRDPQAKPSLVEGKLVEWRADTDRGEICRGVIKSRYGTRWKVRQIDGTGTTIAEVVLYNDELHEPGELKS